MHNELNALADQIHQDNAHWWRDPHTKKRIEREKATTLFLVISEIVEAGEGERKNLMDDHLGHRPSAEVELADALIRLFDYIGAHKYDIDAALRTSHPNLMHKDFNAMRAYFAFRQFDRRQTKPSQLLRMIQSIARIEELEAGFCPKRDIEMMMGYFLALVFDYCGVWSYDIKGAFAEKRAFNKTRHDHTDAARIAEGGKKW
jgi:hypothetical protein